MELRLRHTRRLRLLATAVAAFVALPAAAPAAAEARPKLERPSSQTVAPHGYRLTAREASRIARRGEKIAVESERHSIFRPTAYTRGPGRWQVAFFDRDRDEVAQARVDDSTGAILEQWTGDQVAWTMARGYEGAFGRKLNAPWVWIPLCLVFLVPFIDPRRPFRLLHLDLLVLVSFGASQVFFNRGDIGVSAPLAYPVLVYLLVRLLSAGFRPRERREALVPVVPVAWLAVAIFLLAGFRVGLNIMDSGVIDVGYAGVIGADRIADGDPLYGDGFSGEVERGDTYGPVSYLAYVPFEQALPWSGSWDDLPAAHAAAITFDLITLLGLVLLGRRLRPGREGRALGIALGFAWAAFPYALFTLETNANDSIVAMFTVLAMLALTLEPARRGMSATARGAAVGLGAAAKFAPLALAPLFATGCGRGSRQDGAKRRPCSWLVFSAALLAVLAAAFLPFLPDGGPRELYDRTLGYQASRPSPFSVWGQVEWLQPLHQAVKAGAVALAVLVAVVPRRRSPLQVAALGAAVLVAVELALTHWFYLYVAWFAPLALVALLGPYRGPAPPLGSEPAADPGEVVLVPDRAPEPTPA
ncbi:MAG: glycosyltransferase 87 family protein [Thermoleophilaceae bacterium]